MSGWMWFFVLVIAALFFIDWKRLGTGEERRATGSDGTEDRPWSDYDYRLEPNEYEGGHGYTVVRNEDGQRLSWRTLPVSKGIDSIGVAGGRHHIEDLQDDAFSVGSELSLVREPDNPHDENAVAVKDASKTLQAGYIPADDGGRIARKLDRGEDWRCFSMWEVWESGQRVNLRVLLVKPEASIALPE